MSEKQQNTPQAPAPEISTKTNTLHLALAIFFTAAITLWLSATYIFPREFNPVELSHKEQEKLEKKLEVFNLELNTGREKEKSAQKKPLPALKPEKYSEVGAKRDIDFSEREINALIAHNTDLASKVAVDLSDNLISLRILAPMDPEVPFVGGKTLKISAGADLHYAHGKPVVIIKGVSFWGVPVPNAWLGNLKNVDLVHEFGDKGFWKSFAAGVDDISIKDDMIRIKLKE